MKVTFNKRDMKKWPRISRKAIRRMIAMINKPNTQFIEQSGGCGVESNINRRFIITEYV